MALRTFLLLAILCPQAAGKDFLSKAVVDDDDLTQVTFGDCKEAANEESLIQGTPTGIPARCKCRPFGKGCPKFRLWIDNVEIPMKAFHRMKKGGKWKAGRGPPTKRKKTARLAKKSSGLAEASSALAKDDKSGDEEENQVPVVKNNEDDDEEWVWTPKGVSAIKKEGVEKQMDTPAPGDDVSVGAKNFMNKHGTAGSAIEYGMIKTAHQTMKAVQLFSANDEDEEGENIQNPFLTNSESSGQEEDSGAADEEDGSDDKDDGEEVESFLQTHSENLHLSEATQAKHELADKLLAEVNLGSHPSIPARCKCKPFGKGCPKYRLWIDGKEIPLKAMHKTKKGAWKADRRNAKRARLAKKSSGLAKESSALAKDDKSGGEEKNQVPVVENNRDDEEAWVWTRKGVSAIKQEGVAKNMSSPAAGEAVSVAAKNFMNKHGSAGQAIAHGMIKTSEVADADTENADDGAEVDLADDAEVEDDTEAADEQEQGFDVETDEVDDDDQE